MSTIKEEEKIIFNEDISKETRFEDHYRTFLQYKETKEQPIRFFTKNGVARNILDYIRDSVDRMNEYNIKPAHKEPWQSNVFDPITRDKLIAILSIIAGSRMKPDVLLKPNSIFNTKDLELRRMVYSDLLENANIHNSDDQQLIWEMYTALSEGTIFGFESWKKDEREVEYVKEFNPDTGEIKSEKIKIDAWDDVYGEIIPIDEIYPETIWVNSNDFKKKVKRVFWVREMTLSGFISAFGGFKGAKEVQNAGYYMRDNKLPWGISSDIKPDNVQVMQFFDCANDKMGIWANGKEIYYGAMPWNHKMLPIWVAIGEPIHHQCLFGKSLPDKLMGMQDVNNGVLNAMLDQLLIALNSPVFVDGEVELDDGYLEPGRVYEVAPGTKAERVALGAVDPTAFQMLNLIKRSMEETSISAQAQGVPSGGRKTKFEVQQLQEGALNLAGLFLQIMESALAHKYLLRLHNILQYYSMPSRVESGKPQFKFLVVENRKLSNGRMGKKMIQIVGSKEDIPDKESMVQMAENVEGKPFDIMSSAVEPVVLTRDYLMNKEFELTIRIVPNSSVKQSQAQKDNKDLAFYQATAENPLIDQEMNLRDFARAFGKDERIVKKPEPAPAMPGLAGLMGGQPAPAPAGGGQPQIDLNQI